MWQSFDRAGQPFGQHRVDRFGVAHAVAPARALQQVRRVRHRLGAAGDDDVDVADANRFDGVHDRLRARSRRRDSRSRPAPRPAGPASSAACRATFMPAPACSTQPSIDVADLVRRRRPRARSLRERRSRRDRRGQILAARRRTSRSACGTRERMTTFSPFRTFPPLPATSSRRSGRRLNARRPSCPPRSPAAPGRPASRRSPPAR